MTAKVRDPLAACKALGSPMESIILIPETMIIITITAAEIPTRNSMMFTRTVPIWPKSVPFTGVAPAAPLPPPPGSNNWAEAGWAVNILISKVVISVWRAAVLETLIIY